MSSRVELRKAVRLLLPCVVAAWSCGAPDHSQSAPAPRPAQQALAAASPPPAAKPKLEPMNVLLLSIDCLRADMPWNGYERAIAPNLTKLAEQGVVYSRAYSVSSYTAQSVVSYLSGRYAATLYRSGVFFTRYTPANLFFPETLAERGIHTLGWFAHAYFGRGKGLDQGFGTWELVPNITFDATTDKNVTSPKMLDLGRKILGSSENTGGRFFAWAHWGDPHDVYIKHPESPDFGNKARDKYDSEVWYTDYHIGKLLEWAKGQPWWSRTAVVITADHGESFGEHGLYRHAFEVWENLVRVPLVVYWPGIEPRRIDQRRSLIDLAPTLMELLGEEPLEQFMGKSVVPELRGDEAPAVREPIAVWLTEDSHNPERRAIIEGDYKLTARGRNPVYSLYDLARDPGESKDVSKTDAERFQALRASFDHLFSEIPRIEPFGGNKLESGHVANGPMGPPAAARAKSADGKTAKNK